MQFYIKKRLLSFFLLISFFFVFLLLVASQELQSHCWVFFPKGWSIFLGNLAKRKMISLKLLMSYRTLHKTASWENMIDVLMHSHVRVMSAVGWRPDQEWRRAETDNKAAKWPLSWSRETERKLLWTSLPLSARLSLSSPLVQGGQDVERESVDRRRYGHDQNSRTQLDSEQRVEGTSTGIT